MMIFRDVLTDGAADEASFLPAFKRKMVERFHKEWCSKYPNPRCRKIVNDNSQKYKGYSLATIIAFWNQTECKQTL